MIEAYIYRNKAKAIYGVKVTDHADTSVCNAASILVLNAANSIEAFCDVDFDCDYDDDGGYFWINIESIKNGIDNHDAELILKSLVLGLKSIELEYANEIKVYDGRCKLND